MASESVKTYEEKMGKTINVLNSELASIRAGRANPSLLDKIMVDYFGTPTPIQSLAAVSVSESRILVIQPWDKNVLNAVEKAIQKSDLGINPSNDGNVIRVAFPQPTEERRKELCKKAQKFGEDSKIAIRSIRRDANEKFKTQKKKSEITEDDLKDLEKEIQTITDKFIKEIDGITAKKEKEILEI
ncbi:MAG: ribosome recycling factor [Oscillospiraceae bacterium]|nr:ribosome recycling factor [Oscillospiraceae bacterium]